MSPRQEPDPVDWISNEWRRERPDLNLAPLATQGRIRRVSVLFHRMIAERIEPFGLSVGEFEVLAAIRRGGAPFEINPTDLRYALIVSGGTITNRIARLERNGLVTRRRQPGDARALLVVLTDEGLKVFDQAFAVFCEVLDELVSPIQDEQEKLADILRKLLLQFGDWDGFRPRGSDPRAYS